jgi:hypothetical protein
MTRDNATMHRGIIWQYPGHPYNRDLCVEVVAKGVRVFITHVGYYLELAWRSYRRNPWLTLSVVLTPAIGIGTSMTPLALLHILSADPIPGKSTTLFQPRRVYADATHSPHIMIDFHEARALLDAAGESSRGTILAAIWSL